jgi:hypothetical protein
MFRSRCSKIILDFKEDIKIKKAIVSYMRIKKQDELHALMRKVYDEILKSVWLELGMTELKMACFDHNDW